MDNKQELIAKEQNKIAMAEQMERLSLYPEFKEFINVLKFMQEQANFVLHNPKQINSKNGYTEEDDKCRLKEAQVGYSLLERVIKLIDAYQNEKNQAIETIKKLENK